MALTGFSFVVLLFFTAALYWLVPKRHQWMILLIASIVFYLSFGVAQAGYVLITAAASYAAGRLLGKKNAALKLPGADKPRLRRQKRVILLSVVALDLGLLIALKYRDMFFSAAKGWIVPLGISFYTLSALGYVIDLYHAKYEPEANPLRFLLFITFFLQIVQGPFARYDAMGKQLRSEHTIDYDGVKMGLVRILWGFMKKMVVADWLGVFVGEAMGHPAAQSAPVMAIAILLYTVQMYSDFSGYMDIVCGAGQLFGLKVPENFDRPLGAHSVAEFWRRWHITLGAWFKDYVFFPISVSKPASRLAKAFRAAGKARLAKLCPAILALCAVWPLTGLWHGASWNFLIWGVLNGTAIVTGMLMEPVFRRWMSGLGIDPKHKWWRVFTVARTFVLLALIRVFSRTGTLSEAINVFATLGNWADLQFSLLALFPEGFRKTHMAYCAAAVFFAGVMFVVEAQGSMSTLFERFNRKPLLVKYLVGIALLYVVILFSATGDAVNATFLYANF